jgi:outer membrane protein TolC
MDKTDEIRREYQNATQELEYLTRLDELYREKLDQSSQQIKIAEERYRMGLIELLELDKTRPTTSTPISPSMPTAIRFWPNSKT